MRLRLKFLNICTENPAAVRERAHVNSCVSITLRFTQNLNIEIKWNTSACGGKVWCSRQVVFQMYQYWNAVQKCQENTFFPYIYASPALTKGGSRDQFTTSENGFSYLDGGDWTFLQITKTKIWHKIKGHIFSTSILPTVEYHWMRFDKKLHQWKLL